MTLVLQLLAKWFWDLGFRLIALYFAIGLMSLTLTGTFYYIVHVHSVKVKEAIIGFDMLKPLRDGLYYYLEMIMPYLIILDFIWLISFLILALGWISSRRAF